MEISNVGCQCAQICKFLLFPCYINLSYSSWPSPTASSTCTFTRFPTSRLSDPFSALPTELLLDILQQLPIRTLLSLSSASRNLRVLITESSFLNQTIKATVLGGSEFWILPVTTLPGEEERARQVAMNWFTTASSDHPLTTESPFHSPSFPYLAFVHACYESDSMRNRQRLWNIVKQFDGLWRDYRLHGW